MWYDPKVPNSGRAPWYNRVLELPHLGWENTGFSRPSSSRHFVWAVLIIPAYHSFATMPFGGKQSPINLFCFSRQCFSGSVQGSWTYRSQKEIHKWHLRKEQVLKEQAMRLTSGILAFLLLQDFFIYIFLIGSIKAKGKNYCWMMKDVY